MRETSARSAAQGVGANPIFSWGRFTLKAGADPELHHGIGLSVKRTEAGKWTVTLDGGVRPQYWTAFIQAVPPPPVPEPPPEDPEAEPAEAPAVNPLFVPVEIQVVKLDERAGQLFLEGDDTLDGVVVGVLVVGGGP